MPYLPLQQKPFASIDSESNSQALEYFIDFLKDDMLHNKSRPGLGGATGSGSNTYLVDLGTGSSVHGVFDIPKTGVAAVFSGGRLFKVTSAGVATEITGGTIAVNNMVSFADFGDIGYFCNNSAILKWTYTDNTCAVLSDADAPTDAVDIAFLDSYLFALRADSQRVEYSASDNPDSWDGSFVTIESQPDNTVGLFGHFGEIFLPGESTCEFWTTTGDADSPLEKLQGATIERGCSATDSVQQIDNGYFFLDNERRVVRLVGRSPQIISNPYDREFQDLSTVSDARGFHVTANGLTLYLISFPTADRTFFYDYKLDYWGEWSRYSISTGLRDDYVGQSGVFIKSWNKYLIGSRVDGKVFEMSDSYTAENGETILAELWTGRIDWGSNKRKASLKLTLKIKRGLGAGTLQIYHRDNGKTAWSNPYQIPLGVLGDNESTIVLRRLGNYYDRQWRFTATGPVNIISADEDVEIINV